MTRNFLISVGLLATAQMASAQSTPYLFAVAFDGATSMERIPDSIPGPIAQPDGTTVMFSSCGFARISYETVPLIEYLKSESLSSSSQSFIWMMGEWCQSSYALLERNYRVRHLLGYSRSEDENILAFFLEIYRDEDGESYVADQEILTFYGLQDLARSIPHGRNDSGCVSARGPQDEQRGRIPVGDSYCFESGVYLEAIASLEYADE